ncbi:MAG: hypothetical protein HEQ22_00485 [Sphingopyxis sp.]|uniref:hypothetical protein n=1 Tax=Sphingopyxis sp. TaxID=1908224 RepID=UPI003D80CF2F
MMQRRWALGAATMALLASATAAEVKWLRADTDNFIIYSEGSERSLRDFAETLQRFDATLRFRFKVPGGRDPNRLPIYLVQQTEEAARLASGKRGASIAGFYSPDPEGSFAVSHRENFEGNLGTSDSQQTLFHEYGHHFMKRYVTAAFPAWFIEGFAEYYSTVDFTRDGKAEIGKAAYRRAYGLLEMPKIPADTILLERPGAMKNGGQVDVYYGRAWVLTHMLYNHPERVGQLTTYINAINTGKDAKEAATEAFGDLAQLDKDLNRYMVRPLTYRTTLEPIPVADNIVIAPLSAVEDALLPLHLERISADRGSERMSKVRDRLKLLADRYPADAGVWFELAAAEWATGEEARDLAAVRAALDLALAAKADHVRANVLLARLNAFELDKKGDYSAGAWRSVRQPIQLANRTNPDDPVPLYAYFESFTDQGVRPPDIAVQGLERAFALAPENIQVRVAYAFALANKGSFDPALKLAQSIAFDPHGSGGEQLLQQLERMRDRESPNSASEPAASD